MEEKRNLKEIIEVISEILFHISDLDENKMYKVSIETNGETIEKEVSALEHAKELADAINTNDIYDLLVLLGYDIA